MITSGARSEPAAAQCGAAPRWPPPFGFPDLNTAIPAGSGAHPRSCSINGEGFRFTYAVDGQPTVIRGMGYNPRSAELPTDQRLAQLSRDFTAMRDAGVNTVFGWDPVEFDGLTLHVADERGLGVAVPYDIDFNADFREAEVRQRAMAELRGLVGYYRGHPAVRLWAIGNEAFQRTVPPRWCQTPIADDEAQRARAMARFIVEAMDAVHADDPLHPVLYREAEESYLAWLAEALDEHPISRPWLVYGMNAYTPRLGQILEDWPRMGLDMPVIVSEFALYSAERGSRAEGFGDLWTIIRRYPGYVLGGAVYVWYTDGPETVDQVYGLVDADGRPVDDALAAISQLYRAEAARA